MSNLQQSEWNPDNGLSTGSYPFLPGMDGAWKILSLKKKSMKNQDYHLDRTQTLKSALAHLLCLKGAVPSVLKTWSEFKETHKKIRESMLRRGVEPGGALVPEGRDGWDFGK